MVVPGGDVPPPLAWTEASLQRVLSAALFCLGFFLPFSTAGVSLSGFAVIVVALLMPQRLWRTRPWREPVAAIGLVLLAYIAVRTWVFEGLGPGAFSAVNRYHELLVLPLMLGVFRIARRPQAFANGLMASALLYGAMHWLVPFSDALSSYQESHRVSAGFVLAICAFLFFEHARLKRLPPLVGYGAALFLALTVLFAGGGRTGYVVLILLLSCAAFRATPARPHVRAAAMLGFLAVGLTVAASSQHVRDRVRETLKDLPATLQGRVLDRSSTNARFEIWRNGAAVAGEHWLAGTGWVNYAREFREEAERRHGDISRIPGAVSDNPHNEYLMQLGAGGLPAFLLFLLWLAWPMQRVLREGPDARPWAGAVGCVAVAFAVGALFNSVLLDFTEGHFYAILMAWLLVRRAAA